jgi:hypothetical protein
MFAQYKCLLRCILVYFLMHTYKKYQVLHSFFNTWVIINLRSLIIQLYYFVLKKKKNLFIFFKKIYLFLFKRLVAW